MHDLISPQIYEPAVRGCWWHHGGPEGREGTGYWMGGQALDEFMDCDCLALGKCLPGEPPLPPMGEFVDDPKLNRGVREGWSPGQTEYPDLPKDHVYKPYDRIVRVGWEPSASGLTPDGYEGTNRVYESKGKDAGDPVVPRRRPVSYDSPDLIQGPPSEAPVVRAGPAPEEPERGEGKNPKADRDGGVESAYQEFQHAREHARGREAVPRAAQNPEKAGKSTHREELQHARRHARDWTAVVPQVAAAQTEGAESAGESAYRMLRRKGDKMRQGIPNRHNGNQEESAPPAHKYDSRRSMAGTRDVDWKGSQLKKFEERQRKGVKGDLAE